MIIKKKNFNLTPGCRGKWPFTVPEVGAVIVRIEGAPDAFAVVHNWGAYALSGLLESHGFAPLIDSGIWGDEWNSEKSVKLGNDPVKKSLSPFFKYLQRLVDGNSKQK